MDKQNNTKKEQEPENDEKIENIEKPSYTYWKRDNDKPFSNEFKPQKSDPKMAETANNINSYGSAWNKGGTWEEKHFSKTQVEEFFSKSLPNKKNIKDCCALDKITAYSGDVIII